MTATLIQGERTEREAFDQWFDGEFPIDPKTGQRERYRALMVMHLMELAFQAGRASKKMEAA